MTKTNSPETTLFSIFPSHGHQIYAVGGIVRDTLNGDTSNDWDFATSALPSQIKTVLYAHDLPVIPIGEAFGTIATIIGEHKVEITTFRSEESYTKASRHPTVRWGNTIEEDLARRDFTINAMAIDHHGDVIDPHNGREDLANGIIRTPGDAHTAFTDDPLRILRAARFVARGYGDLHDDTLQAAKALADQTLSLSAERVFDEMNKLLLATNPQAGLEILERTHVLAYLFPELQMLVRFTHDQGKYHHLPVWEHTLQVVQNAASFSPSPAVMWSALYHDVAKPLTYSRKGKTVHFIGHAESGVTIWEQTAQRLRTSNDFRSRVGLLIAEHQNFRADMGDKALRRFVHRLDDALTDGFTLRRADILAHKPSIVQSALADLNALERRCEALQAAGGVNATLPTGLGTQIAQALAIKPGPELGRIMDVLRRRLIEGTLDGTSDFIAEAKVIHANMVHG